MIYVGKAGWSLRKEHQPQFPGEGTHLERYARRLPAVEINSSFRSWHRPSTYSRWASSVPAHFPFSIKVHEQVTHKGDLEDWEPMARFLEDTSELGDKLGAYLVQLPPSHKFDQGRAEAFFERLWSGAEAHVACEPRHASWFEAKPKAMLEELEISLVAADPPAVEGADTPAGWDGFVYHRLHGSPKMYYDSYSDEELRDLADRLQSAAEASTAWCIFDNTARGAGTSNALDLWQQVRGEK